MAQLCGAMAQSRPVGQVFHSAFGAMAQGSGAVAQDEHQNIWASSEGGAMAQESCVVAQRLTDSLRHAQGTALWRRRDCYIRKPVLFEKGSIFGSKLSTWTLAVAI
ncbi:hypothetical protein A2U01_0009790 [Trifolium medium]|uniref:Uncharacterized protein n=1 Tax=Trifolium medium TaxID=97028 RepID=A0A392MN16_9FABA|nr:hypothetical protein [Trifolium medium]